MHAERPILVADDVDEQRRLLTRWLEDDGYVVLGIRDGERTLAAAAAHWPALILLDIMLPGLNGFEVCRHLQAHQRMRQIPVVMVTGLPYYPNAVAALEAGARDVLGKPLRREDVLGTVHRLLCQEQVPGAQAGAGR
jgi:CheY-like chemotaxis protein